MSEREPLPRRPSARWTICEGKYIVEIGAKNARPDKYTPAEDDAATEIDILVRVKFGEPGNTVPYNGGEDLWAELNCPDIKVDRATVLAECLHAVAKLLLAAPKTQTQSGDCDREGHFLW